MDPDHKYNDVRFIIASKPSFYEIAYEAQAKGFQERDTYAGCELSADKTYVAFFDMDVEDGDTCEGNCITAYGPGKIEFK
jgi:hypothetical protein